MLRVTPTGNQPPKPANREPSTSNLTLFALGDAAGGMSLLPFPFGAILPHPGGLLLELFKHPRGSGLGLLGRRWRRLVRRLEMVTGGGQLLRRQVVTVAVGRRWSLHHNAVPGRRSALQVLLVDDGCRRCRWRRFRLHAGCGSFQRRVRRGIVGDAG